MMKIPDLRLSLYLFKKAGVLKRKIEGFISGKLTKKPYMPYLQLFLRFKDYEKGGERIEWSPWIK